MYVDTPGLTSAPFVLPIITSAKAQGLEVNIWVAQYTLGRMI